MPHVAHANLRRLNFRSVIVTAAATFVMSIVIVVTGAVVRVTGSGLGCPTWPRCDATSLTTTRALGIHGLIEFGNRMLTGVLSVTVAALILAVLLQRVRPPQLIVRAAWTQAALVLVNAVIGGITVLARLSPWVVAIHLIAAFGLLTTTTITWHRVREYTRPDQAADAPAASAQRMLARACMAATAVAIVLGTLVTGSGPHSGDSADVDRMPFNWTAVTIVHGVAVAVTTVLSLILVQRLKREAPQGIAYRRAILFLVALLAQGLIGVVQALTGLPSWMVILHLLGACLVWAGALRLVLDTTAPLRAHAELEQDQPLGQRVSLKPYGA